jgi:peptidylprolyl isomerase
MNRLPLLLSCAVLACFGAACGDDEEEAGAPAATAQETPAASPEATGSVDAGAIGENLGTKPEIAKPAGSPPTDLVVTDVVKGKGKTAKAGDDVDVRYVGTSWSTGAEFDSSWSRGKAPFSFPLGAGRVIPGWDQGVAGMKVGGRRLLVIPPDLGYGAQGSPPVIAPNETLIFVVDLKRVA